MVFLMMVISLIIGSAMIMLIDKHRKNMFQEYMVLLVRPLQSTLNNQIIHNMNQHQPDHFQLILEDLKTEGAVKWVNILNTDLEVVFATDTNSIGKKIVLPSKKFSIDDEGDSLYVYTSFDELPLMKMVSIIYNEPACYDCHDEAEKYTGYIEVGVESDVKEQAHKMLLKYDFSMLVFIMAFFAIMIGIVHQRFFQGPYDKIKQQVKEIKEGDYSKRVRVKTPGELQSLADDINAMAAEIEANKMEIEQLHKSQIERASQLASVGELAASVAHEIRNPISGIYNALVIMADKNTLIKNDPIKDEIFSQIRRVLKTIQDLIEFGKPPKLKFEMVDISEIVRESVWLQKQKIESEGIQLIEIQGISEIPVNGDKEYLKQVIANILLNAYQAVYGTPQPKIILSTKQDRENFITISIMNNNSYIPEAKINEIFKPFYTSKHKGSGLGLSLSKSIIEKHGGHIRVKSSETEMWTEFLIDLPVHSTAEEKA